MRKKILITLLITMLLLITIYNKNYALNFDPESFHPDATTQASGADRILNIGNLIIGVLSTVGTIASVAVLAILGIKYMLGSAEEKADYKTSMKPYLIGAILVFGITNILSIIVEIVTNVI